MAQRPTNDFNIDPNVTSGTDLANILNRFQDAIDSGNSGSSRPAYLDAGGLWVREGDPMRLYLYDGTTDRELYNTTDGLVGASQWEDVSGGIAYTDGNVGVGTNDPEAPLSVQKGNTVGTANNASAVFQASDANGVDAKLVLGVRSGGRPYVHAVDGDTKAADSLDFGIGANASAMRIDPDGNVGIGTDNPQALLEVKGSNASARFRGVGSQLINVNLSDSPSSAEIDVRNAGDFFISKQGFPVVTINNDGNVGIGMNSLRSTAKEQLAEWKASFDARLKAEPKADKKAVTLEITDDAFEVLPTEEALAEWMETRAAGDKLQVNGNISATGTVKVDNTQSASRMLVLNATTSATSAYRQAFAVQNSGTDMLSCTTGPVVTLDTGPNQFKLSNAAGSLDLDNSGNATFSGTVTVEGSRPVSTKEDLIETLSTLRNATKDETTLEGLRDAIGDAVGGLIQKFEAIQAEAEKAATMDIDD